MRCVGVGCWLLLCGCGRIGFADLSATADDATGSDVANPAGFSSLVAYGDQTCALYKGTAYCWGRNDNGQIGDGTNNDGRPVEQARNDAVREGVTINGLPLLIRPSNWGYVDIANLDEYLESIQTK